MPSDNSQRPVILYMAYITRKPLHCEYFEKVAKALREDHGIDFVGFDLRGKEDGAPSFLQDTMRWSRIHPLLLPMVGGLFGGDHPAWDQAMGIEAGFKKIPAKGQAGLSGFSARFKQVLARHKPSLLLLGHQFSGPHWVAADLARRLGMPVAFDHPGVLPGTMCQEFGGQMGESWVAEEPEKLLSLPLDEEDLRVADDYLDHYCGHRDTKARHPQMQAPQVYEAIDRARAQGKRLLFYAGINDYRTGMLPRDLPKAKWHSPYVESTEDGLERLLAYCRQRGDVQLVFKPHPSLDAEYLDKYDLDKEPLIVAVGANIYDVIEKTDATASICSQVLYEACLRNRPAIPMGRLQMIGYGFAHEALREEDLGPAIEAALSEGFSPERAEKFRQHVARLLKYYLFGWLEPASGIMTRGPAEAAKLLAENMPKEEIDYSRLDEMPPKTPSPWLYHKLVILSLTVRKFFRLRNRAGVALGLVKPMDEED